MTNHTSRQIRIANDTGLSISEVQEYLDEGLIQFSKRHKKYYISETAIIEHEKKQTRKPHLSKAELRWLTK